MSSADGKSDIVSAVLVDRESCIGSGNCVEVAPNSFTMDDNGVANYSGDTPADEPDTIPAAAASCPVAAITLTPHQTTSET